MIKFLNQNTKMMRFVRSGRVYLPGRNDSTLLPAGRDGDYWSLRGSDTDLDGATTPSVYDLSFNGTAVRPSNGPISRFHGFTLRCLSTVIDI